MAKHAKHPEFINTDTLRNWLGQTKTEKITKAVCSDANLIVPFLLATVNKQELIELVNTCRNRVGFTQNDSFWENTSIPLIIEWAKSEVEDFRRRKIGENES